MTYLRRIGNRALLLRTICMR